MSRTPLTGGTIVQAPILPEYQESNYPTHLDIYGQGGWRGVSSILAISQLPVGYLSIGMIVIAQDTMFAYQYTGNNTNTITGTVVATSQSVTLVGWITFVTSSGSSGGTVNFNNGVSGTLSTLNGGTGSGYSNFAALATAVATQIGLQAVNGIVKSNGSGAFSAAGSTDITGIPLTGFVSTSGTITPTTTILQAIEYLSANTGSGGGSGTTVNGLLAGNGSAIIAATASQVTGMALTGYSAGSVTGAVQPTDTLLQAITKLAGSSSNPLTTQLTGYTTAIGTVSSNDTILSAIEKLQNAITALSGSTLAAHTLFYGTVPAATYSSLSAASAYLTASVVSVASQTVATLSTSTTNSATTLTYTVPGSGGWIWIAVPTADLSGGSLQTYASISPVTITQLTTITISGIGYTVGVMTNPQVSTPFTIEWLHS